MDVKKAVFTKLDQLARPGAVLATNTSTLDVDQIAAVTSRPGDVVGMHFFSPANVMKLLEVVRGKQTADDVLVTAMAIGQRIGKTCVVARVCDGFIGNRMLAAYRDAAGDLLRSGATPAEVDTAIEAFGFAMGPFKVGDLAGNDISWAIRKRRYVERPEVKYSKVADLLCERGRFGQKTGAGWYDYKPGDRTAYPSKLVEELILEHSRTLNLTRRAISDEEIVPSFRAGRIDQGILRGVLALAGHIAAARGVTLTGVPPPPPRAAPTPPPPAAVLFGVLLIVILLYALSRSPRRRGWYVGPGFGAGFGSGFGGGGGGFGGFGGSGGFGGGGAGRSW